MSASGCPELRFAKSRPRALDKADRDKVIVSTDKAEDQKTKDRAAGRCEVFIAGQGRCLRRDTQTHHIQKGWGRRARGTSALAENKLRVCDRCHADLHGHVIVPEGAEQDKAFRRVR